MILFHYMHPTSRGLAKRGKYTCENISAYTDKVFDVSENNDARRPKPKNWSYPLQFTDLDPLLHIRPC
jgi:hypothetical protein